jgi:hypothetical protein
MVMGKMVVDEIDSVKNISQKRGWLRLYPAEGLPNSKIQAPKYK